MASKTTPQDQLVGRLDKQLREARTGEGAWRYELGCVTDQVVAGRLWLVWPRSVAELTQGRQKGKTRGSKGYPTFEEWSWNEAGSSPNRLRALAADYRRLRAIGVRRGSQLHKRLMGLGVGKLRAILRNVDTTAEGARKKVDHWLERVENYAMTEAQLRAWIIEEKRKGIASSSVPEGRPPALAMPRPPKAGRNAQWRAVDKALVKAAEHACISDADATIAHLKEAIKWTEAAR